jgi:hypothetical protein
MLLFAGSDQGRKDLESIAVGRPLGGLLGEAAIDSRKRPTVI